MASISAPIIIPKNPFGKQQNAFHFKRNPARSMSEYIYSSKPPISPPPHAKDHQPIKIVCISDTHNTTPSIPDGDILLHVGDLTNKGTFAELQSQLAWLNSLPHKHKVVIAGNHDLLLDPEFVDRHPERIIEREGAAFKDLDWGHVTYLNNTSTTLNIGERSLTVFGSPFVPQCGTWAFQYPPIRDVWNGKVPSGTDVFLTHGPAKGHLDSRGKGCGWLVNELWRIKPRLVVCGHIHEGRGREDVDWGYLQKVYDGVECAELGLISVLCMGIVWAVMKMWFRVFGRKRAGVTTLINAAVVGGLGSLENYPSSIVEI